MAAFMVHSLCAMNPEDKAQQLKNLRAMHEQFTAGPSSINSQREKSEITQSPRVPQKPLPQPPVEDSMAESLNLIESHFVQELARLQEEHEKSVHMIWEQGALRDERMTNVIDRQAETILRLNELMKQLMSRGYKLETRVTAQEDNVSELRQDTDQQIEHLFTAIGDQSEMFVRQNGVIRELMSRVEKLSGQLSDQRRKQATFALKLKVLRDQVQEMDEKETERRLDELLEFFNYKKVRVTTPLPEDPGIFDYVLGNGSEDLASVQRKSSDGSSESEVKIPNHIREELPASEDPKDGITSVSNSSDEIIEEIIIEDADNEQSNQDVPLRITRIRPSSSSKGKEDVSN